MDIVSILGKAQEIIGLVIVIFGGVIGIAMMIPGEQPEKFLQGAVDFLKRFSKK